jgi:hypothetical protein
VKPPDQLNAFGIKLPKPWTSATAHLPKPLALGPGVKVYAEFVRVVGRRATISGHLPIDEEGAVCGPFGRVGAEVTIGGVRCR